MAQIDLPIRNRRDLGRTTRLREITSRRPSTSVLDETCLSHPMQDVWTLSNGLSTSNPYYARADFHRMPIFPSYNPSSIYPYYAAATSEDTSQPRNTIPFPAAARALYTALTAFLSYAERLEGEFRNDTLFVSSYIDEPTIAHLWACKLDYRGVPAWQQQQQQQQQTDESDVESVPEPTFGKHAVRLLEAIDDWRGCEDLSARELEEMRGMGGGLRVEDVRVAWKKLEVGCGALEELVEGVRTERKRCGALVRELASAGEVLQGIREVWDGRSKKRSGGRERF